MMDALVETLLFINFLCIIWYFVRDTVKENAKKYDFKHTFGIEKTFWALIPNVNLNFSQGFTFEIEILCFHYYFDVTKKKDFSAMIERVSLKFMDNIFSSVKVPEHIKLKPDFGGIPADDFIDNCKKFSGMDVRDSKNDGWDKFPKDVWMRAEQGDLIFVLKEWQHDLAIIYGFYRINSDYPYTWIEGEFDLKLRTTDSFSQMRECDIQHLLIKESEKRGFIKGSSFKSMTTGDIINYYSSYFNEYEPYVIRNKGRGVIYHWGKWAEIVTKNEGKTD